MDYNHVDHEDCLSIKTLKDKAPNRGSMLLPRIIHCSLFIIIFICIVILGFVITLTYLSTDTSYHEETHADTKDKLIIQDQHSNMSSLHKRERRYLDGKVKTQSNHQLGDISSRYVFLASISF